MMIIENGDRYEKEKAVVFAIDPDLDGSIATIIYNTKKNKIENIKLNKLEVYEYKNKSGNKRKRIEPIFINKFIKKNKKNKYPIVAIEVNGPRKYQSSSANFTTAFNNSVPSTIGIINTSNNGIYIEYHSRTWQTIVPKINKKKTKWKTLSKYMKRKLSKENTFKFASKFIDKEKLQNSNGKIITSKSDAVVIGIYTLVDLFNFKYKGMK